MGNGNTGGVAQLRRAASLAMARHSASGATAPHGPAPVEELHALARAWQADAPGRVEVQPGADLAAVAPPQASPGNFASNSNEIIPVAVPEPGRLLTLYGERQLGAALARYDKRTVALIAKGQGIPSRGSRAEIITRITSALTHGHYSANFGAAKATGARTAATGTGRAAATRARLEARIATLEARIAEHQAEIARHGETLRALAEGRVPTAAPPPSRRGGSGTRAEEPLVVLHANQPLRPSDPYSPPDPHRLTYTYGYAQLRRALQPYMVETLRATAALVEARNPGTKPKNRSSRQALIDYIVEHTPPEYENIPPP